jgi:hypothetical protein
MPRLQILGTSHVLTGGFLTLLGCRKATRLFLLPLDLNLVGLPSKGLLRLLPGHLSLRLLLVQHAAAGRFLRVVRLQLSSKVIESLFALSNHLLVQTDALAPLLLRLTPSRGKFPTHTNLPLFLQP